MTLPIQFSAEASAELDDAAIWYDEQRAGLGDEFLDVVSETLDTLASWPHSGAPVDDVPADLEVRRAGFSLPVPRRLHRARRQSPRPRRRTRPSAAFVLGTSSRPLSGSE